MNQTVIINIGVSGSGKTTWTNDYIKNNPNTLRVNRDDIRKVLVGNLEDYYQRQDLNKIEDCISVEEKQLLGNLLNSGYNIIIDNTHLKPSYINNIISYIESWSKYINISVNIEFKIFDLEDASILKTRVLVRDGNPKLDYIDKQLAQLKLAISYIETNYPNQILK